MATAVVEIAPQLVEPVDGEAFDWDLYESLRERAKEHSTDWERQWLVTRINNVQSQDLADYERTKTKFEDILTALSETEALSGRELELLEEEAYTAYAQTLKSHAEQSLATGKDHAADGDHKAALEAFEEVAFETNATLEKIQEWEIGKVDEITQIQKDLSHRYVTSRIASVESQLKIGIKQFSAEKYETARDTFSEATEFAEQAVNETQDESENEQLLGLLNIAEENADAARRAVLGIGDATPRIHKLGNDLSSDAAVAGYDPSVGKSGSATVGSRQVNTAGGPPAVNPVAPDIDVAYTAITKGDRIGQGGDADVFHATVEVDGESYQVAFKRPRSSGTVHTDRLDRFVNEAETWAKLDDHDHIVGIVDWDTTPIPWILLEYMDGGDLSEYAGALELEQSIWIAQCVAEGVSHAHSRGIAHLDLKPENILFRTTGPETYPVPKVADWGLSKAILHDKGEMDGFSPQYAAPEQVDTDRFGTPDQTTDLYQLGAVFYDLFVGHPPFEGDIDAVLTSIVEEEVVPPSEANSDLPKAIDGAILTALEKEKRDRYESVLYLRDALAEVSDPTMP
jgi:serine/threonine protein kinase